MNMARPNKSLQPTRQKPRAADAPVVRRPLGHTPVVFNRFHYH